MKFRGRVLDALAALAAMLALPVAGIAFMLGTKTNAGLDLVWNEAIGFAAGFTGTATNSSATSLTATGTPFSSNQYAGYWVFAGSVYGLILSNTTSVLTVDRWYNPATPGGSVGSTPSTTVVYTIAPGAPPSFFIGITANASAVGSGDTTLPGEITTVGGGLIRKIATVAHTAGAATGTVIGVFTANGTDSVPVVIAKMGVGPSLLSTFNQLFQTLLNATATITISGDQVTVTDTVNT